MLRKIGVLTFHRCINYGSYWQARCLIEGLRAMGHDAVLLNHHSSNVNRREWRCALEPQLPLRSSTDDRLRYAAKTRLFIRALARLPQSSEFELDDPRTFGDWDVVIVGSDEVWNLRHPWYGDHAAPFYGCGIRSKRLISYAASFGSQPAVEGLPPFWADALSDFTRISVRDTNSARIIRDALGREAEIVLDPCLQFSAAVQSVDEIDNDHPYIAIYGHGFPDWFLQIIQGWARKRGYRLVSVGYRNDWADDHFIDAGPHAFANLLAGAAAVATNFFHGCVFALLNRKPFACVSSEYRANKLTGLMQLLSAERHLLREMPDPSPDCILDDPIEPAVLKRIAALRRRSRRFIEKAVSP